MKKLGGLLFLVFGGPLVVLYALIAMFKKTDEILLSDFDDMGMK